MNVKITSPEYVPERITRNYIAACKSLRTRSFTSAVMMFRKVLERAIKELSPNGSSANASLHRLIKVLAEQNIITETMRDWTTVIKGFGNKAVHDEDPDEATAIQVQQFTELFLLYCFTLPERVRLHHSQANQCQVT